jgi:hypothetical protein
VGTRGTVKAALHAWLDAFATVAAGLLAMVVVASLGLWAASAGDLPGGAFHRVVAAMVVIAVGGSVDVAGEAGFIARTDAALDVVPLSVALVGALVVAAVFLLPLRFRAVASSGEMLARVARTAALWLLGLLLIALVARHTFRIRVGGPTAEDIGDILGITPTVGFRAQVPATLGLGLVWLLVVLALAFAVSRKAPLPARLIRHQASVRPPAVAMLLILLAYAAVGLVVGVVVAFTRGHPAETFAVVLLALPNLVWMAFGLGLGASWQGHVDSPIGLPVPHVLDRVLRTSESGDHTVNISSLAEHDGRVWWLVVAAAIALLAAGFVTAVRSPAHMRPWQHALHLGVALLITLFAVGLLTSVSARFGLSLLGIGEIEALGGEVVLRPDLLLMAVLGALWGLVAGFLGSLLATRVRRHGDVADSDGGAG